MGEIENFAVDENVAEKEKILTFIREKHSKGEPIYLRYVVRNHPDELKHAKKLFGSWRKAVESAGVSYESVMKQKKVWDKEKIIAKILELHASGHGMWYRAVVKVHKDLVRAAESHFGGWREAVVAAGLDYAKVMKRPHQIWTKAKVVERIRELAREGKDLRYDAIKASDRSLLYAIEKYYSSFKSAFEDAGISYPLKHSARQNMKIFTIKTRIRSEKSTGAELLEIAKNEGIQLGAVHYPPKLNGYIFVECGSRDELARLIPRVHTAQGILGQEISREEMLNFIVKPTEAELQEGMQVVVTDGRFKGEKAVIKHLNRLSNKITIELVDQPVTIPVTIDTDECRPA